MKSPITTMNKNFTMLIGIFVLFSFSSAKSYSQNYSKAAGVYQAYLHSEPVNIDGMKMFYLLNKNGLVFMAFGSSSGSAFSDVSGGTKSGRILTGNFTMSGENITIMMKKGTKKTYWTYDAADNSISNSSMTLIFIESL
jgi:formate hydrogenlyase subunit 4